ncbi:MAG: 2,3-bisphosphoglycerate-independent phosphoglycerate mutase [Acidobacteriota bacterium]|jgi:2,3-bisphosphoglycerate-independent phosphoglycerate mutase
MGHTRRSPVVLLVMDGWGIGGDWEYNALSHAGLAYYPRLLKQYPWRPLEASGGAVGLPAGQMGNSEVGHLTLGAGRIILQDLPRITRSIETGEFFQNKVLREACRLSRNGTLHLMGLLSDGGVHSHQKHLYALIRMAAREGLKRVAVHPILDGRDTSPTAGAGYLEKLQEVLDETGVGMTASVVGRYYAMDRDKRWDRTEIAYRLYTEGEGRSAESAPDAVRSFYDEDVTDEFMKPIALSCPYGCVEDGDGIIFFNFRSDRPRQISRAFNDDKFNGFQRERRPSLATYTTFTRYQKEFTFPVAFENVQPSHCMGEVLSDNGLKQLRIAETEKYAHVTFFFNGGREAPFEGEERILIPSPKVPTYDMQPEMSARKITDAFLKRFSQDPPDFTLLNFANADMVGHTGVFEAACKAARVVDECLERIVTRVLELDGTVALTADHGNLEKMREEDGVKPHTAHTTNPVPFVWISGEDAALAKDAALGLSSVAPSLLKWMGLPAPEEMAGTPLILK